MGRGEKRKIKNVQGRKNTRVKMLMEGIDKIGVEGNKETK